jgi:hypothetical protein
MRSAIFASLLGVVCAAAANGPTDNYFLQIVVPRGDGDAMLGDIQKLRDFAKEQKLHDRLQLMLGTAYIKVNEGNLKDAKAKEKKKKQEAKLKEKEVMQLLPQQRLMHAKCPPHIHKINSPTHSTTQSLVHASSAQEEQGFQFFTVKPMAVRPFKVHTLHACTTYTLYNAYTAYTIRIHYTRTLHTKRMHKSPHHHITRMHHIRTPCPLGSAATSKSTLT